MNGREIKRLINDFNGAEEEYSYAEHMMHNKDLTDDQREEFEMDADFGLQEMFDIAGKIEKLKPSNYMMNKYIELYEILDNYA